MSRLYRSAARGVATQTHYKRTAGCERCVAGAVKPRGLPRALLAQPEPLAARLPPRSLLLLHLDSFDVILRPLPAVGTTHVAWPVTRRVD